MARHDRIRYAVLFASFRAAAYVCGGILSGYMCQFCARCGPWRRHNLGNALLAGTTHLAGSAAFSALAAPAPRRTGPMDNSG